MSSGNYIKNVAIVGASGNSGRYMVESLLADGKHNITAITRNDSANKMPEGVAVKRVDYDDHESLKTALEGMDILIVTLSARTPPEVSYKLIDAASAANVPWIMPNEYGYDVSRMGSAGEDVFLGPPQLKIREYIKQKGNLSFVAVACGFWYEWSLAIPAAFGIDIGNKTAILYDEGTTKIHTSTWPQVGRMVSKLLSLPIKGDGACLENYKDGSIYGSSFFVNQKELLDSAMRVTGTKSDDWKISYQPSQQRFEEGRKELQSGNPLAFGKMLYARLFYPDGSGNLETAKPLDNAVLGLPKEDMDEATKRTLVRIDELKAV